ncbi:MAG: nucleoside deaminase [Ferruginibacter sp.]|nr:nucleoside deaminase [Cytophagales bacterium]
MEEAAQLSLDNLQSGEGGPFGAVVVKGGRIIARGNNRVTSTNDPTAHAEVVAIREACRLLGTFDLRGCELYTSCEPCPMCLGAIYWARFDKVYFANTRHDAADAGFDDALIYQEIEKPLAQRKLPMEHFPNEKARAVFWRWKEKQNKIHY